MKSEFELNLLKILVACTPNELLLHYGAIGYFLLEYKTVTKEEILKVLNAYVPNERKYFNNIRETISLMPIDEQELLYKSAESLIAISSRHYETPGERNLVKFKLAKIFNKEI
ncbi:hypothetical protein [Flavobacterium aciduliphilum]|uniref:Tellurite resistance protein TerB n=1 Tax=Flavobacterium aciduliphilum TaxID=1101402 RepID=A0A328YKW7_9FLAO|nr:hypothetical protein [Flavobacterium aciduliphilum]RAR73733.1 hypothetical protein CLV55_10352 [Flavobacterium aciduliphilum]